MDTVNIKNTRPSLVLLPECEGNRRPTRLMPGENDVPVNVWEHAQTIKAVQIWVEAGILEVGDGKARPHDTNASAEDRAGAGGRRSDDLSEFDLEQIETIVSDTDDLKLLGAWSDDERPEVQALVRVRMKDVKGKAKKRKKK